MLLIDDEGLRTWHESGGIRLRNGFCSSSSCRDRRSTFARLRRKFSTIADNVTKLYRNDSFSKYPSTFLDSLCSSELELEAVHDVDSITCIFESVVNNTFGVRGNEEESL